MNHMSVLSVLVKAQGIQSTNAQLLGVDRSARKAALSAAEAEKATRGLGQASGQTSRQLARHQSGLKSVERASKITTVATLGLAGAAIKTAADYQSGMNTLQAVSGATGKEMAKLSKLAVQLGADTKLPGTSALDASQAMTEMIKAGVSLQDTMAGARGVLVLSAAAQIDNAKAAEIASNALNTFKLKGRDVNKVVDELANTANASSVEINDVADAIKQAGAVFSGFQSPVLGAKGAMHELNVAVGLLGNAGIKGSDAGTSLKQTLLQLTGPSEKAKGAMRALYAAATGATGAEKALTPIIRGSTKERREAFQALYKLNPELKKGGDIAYDSAGKMRALPDIIRLVTAGTKHMTAEQKNAYLTQIFGADATRSVIALMNAGPAAWDKMSKAVGRQGAAQALAAAKMKGFNGAVEALKSTVETLAIVFGTALLPPLTMLLQKLAGLGPFIDHNRTLIMVAVGALGALAAATWAVTIAMAANPFVLVAVALIALGVALVKAYQTSEAFRKVVDAVWSWLRKASIDTFGWVVKAGTDAINWLVGAGQTVAGEVRQWDTLWSGISRVFGLILGGARLLFDGLMVIFRVGMALLAPIFVAGWTLIKGVFSGAWTAIKGIVTAEFGVLRGIVKIIGGLFKGDFGQIWDGIKEIFTSAIGGLKAILSGAWKVMKAPVDALAAGLHDAFSNTWDRIKGVFESGVNAVIDFLNLLIKAINVIPGIPDIGLIKHVGGGGKSNTPAQKNLGQTGHLARGGAFARTGGLVNRPMTFMGEEAPRHPEFVIPTNPAYRGRARGLLGMAAKAVGFAQGGVWAKDQLKKLWSTVNPGNGDPNLMAAIALAESAGRQSVVNSIGAGGLWQIYPPEPGYLNPFTNARIAGRKLLTQGLGAWEAFTNGSYKQFLGGGGGGILGTIGGALGKVGGAIGGLLSKGASFILDKLPGVGKLPGWLKGTGKWMLDKATGWIKDKVSSLISGVFGGGGGGATSGPNGVGSFGGVPMANWVISSLKYAQGKGVPVRPTSGYRPGFDPHTLTGHSEHSGTQYPHGAVDFGGYHNAAAKAMKDAVVAATADFKWPLLAPKGFVDDGHASGTGHRKGGVFGGSVLGSYERGTPFVPRTGPYLLHKGERVTPAGENATLIEAIERLIMALASPSVDDDVVAAAVIRRLLARPLSVDVPNRKAAAGSTTGAIYD